jgi:hypothetical protein
MMLRRAILSLVAAAFAWGGPGTPAGPMVPRPAGDMVFPLPNGKKTTLGQYHGKFRLVVFLAIDCQHCVQVTEVLRTIQHDLAPRGVQIIAAAVNDETPQQVNEFVLRYLPGFPVGMLDRDAFIKYAQIPPGMRPFVPVFLFVNNKGVVERQYFGDHPFFKDVNRNTRGVLNMMMKEAALAAGKKSAPAKKD